MKIKGSNILISACVCVLLYLMCSQIIHTNWCFRDTRPNYGVPFGQIRAETKLTDWIKEEI